MVLCRCIAKDAAYFCLRAAAVQLGTGLEVLVCCFGQVANDSTGHSLYLDFVGRK